MFCMKCGKEINDNTQFCPYCGSSLKKEKKDHAEKKNNISKFTYYREWAILICGIGVAIWMMAHGGIWQGIVTIIASILMGPFIQSKVLGIKGWIVNFCAIFILCIAASQCDFISENNNSSDVDSFSSQEKTEFYATELVDCGEWNVRFLFTTTSTALGSLVIDCDTEITNTSGGNLDFVSSEFISMSNGGLIGEASSDYDYQTIANGTTIRTNISFLFPDNANTYLDKMVITAGGNTVYLTPKPQEANDYYNNFEGTYATESGMKFVIMQKDDYQYYVIDFNPVSGTSYYDVTLSDEKTFKIGMASYTWVPEDAAIYPAGYGDPYFTNSYDYYWSKTNPNLGGEYEIEDSPDDSDENLEADPVATTDIDLIQTVDISYYNDAGYILTTGISNDSSLSININDEIFWDFEIDSCSKEDDGSYKWYYGKGATLQYYEEENYFHVETDGEYNGDYFPE